MIPTYEEPTLTKKRLTDDIIDAALDDMDFTHMSRSTARDAVYLWLSHAAVWDEEFDKFASELQKEDSGETDPMDAISELAAKVQIQLNMADEREIRSRISLDDVQAAAVDTGCCASVPSEQIAAVIASVLVTGQTAAAEEYEEQLDEYGISMSDVLSVMSRLEEL